MKARASGWKIGPEPGGGEGDGMTGLGGLDAGTVAGEDGPGEDVAGGPDDGAVPHPASITASTSTTSEQALIGVADDSGRDRVSPET